MKSSLFAAASLAALVGLSFVQIASAGEADYAGLVAAHAQANGVPEALVHRVIMRESRYHPQVVGRGGTIGLMQIKLATARGLGYTGDAAGLRDPNTNLTYAVKYLAGAYRAANGDYARAVHYYASGYYYAAKRQHLQTAGQPRLAANAWFDPNSNSAPPFGTAAPRRASRSVLNARAEVPAW